MAKINLLVLATAFVWSPLISALFIHGVHLAKVDLPQSVLSCTAIGLAATISLGAALAIASLNRSYALRVSLACINAMFGCIYTIITLALINNS